MIQSEIIRSTIDWSQAFIAGGQERMLAFRVQQMTPGYGDVFTGKLPFTRSFFALIDSGQVAPMRRAAPQDFGDAVAVLSIIAAHNHIARSGDFAMVPPAFWARDIGAGGGRTRPGRPFPVIPFQQLIALSGRGEDHLNFILRPLHKDGAIRGVRNSKGLEGIAMCDGFINIDRFQASLRQ